MLLAVLLISACGDSTDEAENKTLTPTTTTEPATTTTAPSTTTTEAPELMAEGSGSSGDLVEFSIVKTATAVTFTHNGTGAFQVQDLGADLEPAGLLNVAIGPYQGTRPLQWEAASGGFEITADGDWTYSVFNIDYARHENCPIEGDGDDVVASRSTATPPSTSGSGASDQPNTSSTRTDPSKKPFQSPTAWTIECSSDCPVAPFDWSIRLQPNTLGQDGAGWDEPPRV